MKRSLPLVAILAFAVAALLAPTAALAAPTVAPTRVFEIRALVLGDTRLEVSGKLWLDDTNVGASVGCNSIGAQVSVDGDVVIIVGPATMTEMACPGANGNAEAMLLQILELGRFTIADGRWSADGGTIEVIEAPAPDPTAVPPDRTNPDPNVVCTDVGAPPDAGSGSGSGSSGALDAPCVAVNGGGIGIDRPAPGSNGTAVAPVVDTARDVLFVPLAIGFGVLLLVTAGLMLRGRPTPR